MIALSLLPLLLATTAIAAPSRREASFRGDCNVPATVVTLPPQLDAVPFAPKLFLLGVGVQNYTCNSNGTFDSVGTVAELYETSCIFGRPEFTNLPNDAFNAWNASPITNPLDPGLSQLMKDKFNINEEGQYYFIKNGSVPGLVPVWDLRSSGENKGNPNAIVFAQKVKAAPSPQGPENVDWTELTKVSGDLANLIYRVNTVQGQPPKTCTPGSYASVKYSANYMFL